MGDQNAVQKKNKVDGAGAQTKGKTRKIPPVAIAAVGALSLFLVGKTFLQKKKNGERQQGEGGGGGQNPKRHANATSSSTSRSNTTSRDEVIPVGSSGGGAARERACAAYIEAYKIKKIFVVVMDPMQNNQSRLARTVQMIYENAQCPAALSVAVVTSTVPETQRRVEQSAPVQGLPNIALSYVDVYHPCSVDQAMAAALSHAYNNETYICTVRPAVQLQKDWDAAALRQFHALCPLRAIGPDDEVVDAAALPHIVLTGYSHDRKRAEFPSFSGWARPRKNIAIPTFRWSKFATAPEVSQPSMLFTSAFSFAPADMWTAAAVPDLHLEALTPSVSDWLYTCRLHSIGYAVYTPAQVVAVLQRDVAAPQKMSGADRLIEWFAQPNFLEGAYRRTGVDTYFVDAEWRAHTGLISLEDDDEVMHKYGTLAAAERTMKTLRTQMAAAAAKADARQRSRGEKRRRS